MHFYNYLDEGTVLLLNCCLVLETNFDKKKYHLYQVVVHMIFSCQLNLILLNKSFDNLQESLMVFSIKRIIGIQRLLTMSIKFIDNYIICFTLLCIGIYQPYNAIEIEYYQKLIQ